MTKSQNMPCLFLKISETEIEKLSYERYAYPDPMIQKRKQNVYEHHQNDRLQGGNCLV